MNNGTDWNFPYCNINNVATSPMDITFVNNGTIQTYNDWQQSIFTFIPNYRPSKIVFNEPLNQVYTIRLQDDSGEKGYQGFWGAEPSKTINQH